MHVPCAKGSGLASSPECHGHFCSEDEAGLAWTIVVQCTMVQHNSAVLDAAHAYRPDLGDQVKVLHLISESSKQVQPSIQRYKLMVSKVIDVISPAY